MKAEVINPFLESARNVFEQLIQVSPSTGSLGVKNVEYIADHVWIVIGMTGQQCTQHSSRRDSRWKAKPG